MSSRLNMMISPIRSDDTQQQFHLHLSNHSNDLQTMIGSSFISMSSGLGMLNLRDIHRLIAESTSNLERDPTCLHTRAIRGHACMKAKMYELAIQDFTTILQARPDDVHGRFSRGMAFFKLGHVEKANLDFTQVLQLNPNHVMARYARAGCYNTEGEFYQAIEDYTIALQYDEQENENGSFNVHKKRLYLHENAEKLIHEKLGATGPRGARNSITNSNIKSQSIQITPFSFSVYSPMPSTTGTSDVLHALTQSHSVSPQRAMTTTTPVRIAKIRLDVDDIEENNNRNNCSGSSGNNNDNNTGPATRPVPLRKPSSQRVVPKVVVNLREEIEEKQKQDRVEQTQISFITSPSAVEKKWQKTLQIAHEALGIRPETAQISTTSTNTADTSNTTATSASSDNNNNTEMTPNVKGLQQSQSTPTLVRRVQIVL